MDFAFTSDQQLLKNSARAFLDEHCKPATVRGLWDDPRGESEAMWKEIAQLGWLGLALPEVHGGSDLGMVETSLLSKRWAERAIRDRICRPCSSRRRSTRQDRCAETALVARRLPRASARATAALLDGEVSWAPAAITTRARSPATAGSSPDRSRSSRGRTWPT